MPNEFDLDYPIGGEFDLDMSPQVPVVTPDQEDVIKNMVMDFIWSNGNPVFSGTTNLGKGLYQVSNIYQGITQELNKGKEDIDPNAPIEEKIATGLGNLSIGFMQLGTGMLGLPSAMMRDPAGTIENIVNMIPHEAKKVYRAIKPALINAYGTIPFGLSGYEAAALKGMAEDPAGIEQIVAESKEAWKEIYKDPGGPVFAGWMAWGIGKILASGVGAIGRSGEAGAEAAAKAKAAAIQRNYLEYLEKTLERKQLTAPAEMQKQLPAPEIRGGWELESGPGVRATPASAPPKLPGGVVEGEGFSMRPGGRSRNLTTAMSKEIDAGLNNWLRENNLPDLAGLPRNFQEFMRGLWSKEKIMAAKKSPDIEYRGPNFQELPRNVQEFLGQLKERGGAAAKSWPQESPLAPVVTAQFRGGARPPEAVPMETIGKGKYRPAPDTSPIPYRSNTTALQLWDEATAQAAKATKPEPPAYDPAMRSGVEWFGGEGILEKLFEPTDITVERFLAETKGDPGLIAKRTMFLRHLYDGSVERFQTPTGKVVPKIIYEQMRRGDRYRNTMYEMLREQGILSEAKTPEGWAKRLFTGKIRAKTFDEFFERYPKMRDFFDFIARAAQERGVQVKDRKGKIRDFAPLEDFRPDHMWKKKFRQIFSTDLAGIRQQIQALAEKKRIREDMLDPQIGGHVSEAEVIAELQKHYPKSGYNFHPETLKALKYIVENKYAKTQAEAAYRLASLADDVHFYRGGSLQNTRGHLKLPDEVYITDPLEATLAYIDQAAPALAQWEIWGRGDVLLNELKAQITRQEMQMTRKPGSHYVNEADLAQDMIDVTTGVMARNIDSAWRGVQKQFQQGAYQALVGTGFTTLKQFIQAGISVIPEAGVYRNLKALYKDFKPEVRRAARISGATMAHVSRKYITLGETSGWFDVLNSTNPVLRAFQAVNKGLDIHTATVGAGELKYYHQVYNKSQSAARRSWAYNKAKKLFDVELSDKPITENATYNAMYDLAARKQLHPDVTKEPMLFYKVPILATLKRFSYKQAKMYISDTWNDVSQGNVLPLLRGPIAAYLGTEAVRFAEEQIRSVISGRPIADKKNPWWARFLAAQAYSGISGLFTDPLEIDEDLPENMFKQGARRIGFGLSPVVIEQLYGMGEKIVTKGPGVIKAVSGRGEKTSGEAIGDFMLSIAAEPLAAGGYLMEQRLMSDKAAIKQVQSMRGSYLRRAAIAFGSGDYKMAQERIDAYNKYIRDFVKSRSNLDPKMARTLKPISLRKTSGMAISVQEYYDQYLK